MSGTFTRQAVEPLILQEWARRDLLKLPPSDKQQWLAQQPEDIREALKYKWECWARPEQLIPAGEWTTWLVRAGRGYGKTRVGSETVRQWVKKFSFVNLIGATADDARDIMIEGESGILAVCPKRERPLYISSKRQLQWPNGAKSLIFTADEPERLRGKQAEKIWCDEVGAWRFQEEAWDQAMFGLRLGSNPQVIVTTTPKPTKVIRELSALPSTFLTRGTTYENRTNLATAFYTKIITKYEGTRLGRQELNAELLEDNPNALWNHAMIDAARVSEAPKLVRIVVPIDPAVTSNEDSDETGIVPVGVDNQNPPHFYVLFDASGIYTPLEWGKAASVQYHRLRADRVIGEGNNGGDLVESNLRNVDPDISYKKVIASRGKQTRAEPVAALYEQGRVHHVGTFAILEDQMCDWNPVMDTNSPDRMDSLVWGITELMESCGMLGLVEHTKGKAEELNKLMQSQLTKPETSENTPACPKCGATSIASVGDSWRCGECSKQWKKNPDAVTKLEQPFNRANPNARK